MIPILFQTTGQAICTLWSIILISLSKMPMIEKSFWGSPGVPPFNVMGLNFLEHPEGQDLDCWSNREILVTIRIPESWYFRTPHCIIWIAICDQMINQVKKIWKHQPYYFLTKMPLFCNFLIQGTVSFQIVIHSCAT